MAEEARGGTPSTSQANTHLTIAKQQVGLIPTDEGSNPRYKQLQFGHSRLGSSGTLGFTPPATPVTFQAKHTSTASADMEHGHSSLFSHLLPASSQRPEGAVSRPPAAEQQQASHGLSQQHSGDHGQHRHQQYSQSSSGQEGQQTQAVAVKNWQGPLYVTNHKGEELVCELQTDRWPVHLPR